MASKVTFGDLGLSVQALDAITSKGFETPTEIQALTIPVMLRNDTNIIAQAQTGTGKTAAFGLPLIDMIDPNSKAVQALILVPTRELAIQVSEEIRSLRGDKPITTTPIYGGQSIDQQFRKLRQGVHIVVGTPGRVIDHLNRKTLKLQAIEHLVLDEADEMLNMGFIEDMEKIFKHTNSQKRTLLFSATMPEKIKELAHSYMDGYELLAAKKEQLTPNLTKQIYYEVRTHEKLEALCRVIDVEEGFYGLVFCRTRNDVDTMVSQLMERGYDAEAIHGDISQPQRERTLNRFKRRKINILVATDVAARGIDVSNLTHVINHSLPHDPEAYVHRIGRTGRAGNEGTAITFITHNEYRRLMYIQRTARTEIKRGEVPKVKDIIKAKKRKIYCDLTAILEKTIDAKYQNWAERLLEDNAPSDILAAVLNYCFEERLNPDGYGRIAEFGENNKKWDTKGKVKLFVGLGKKDNMSARKLVDLVLSKVPIKPNHIDDIQVMDHFSFMTVPTANADKIVVRFKEKGGKSLITRVRQGKKKHHRHTTDATSRHG